MVLGVSFDTESENAAFAEKFHFDFPLLCDTTRELGIAYGACEDATARTAKRISYLIGPDGTVRRAYPRVSAASHPAEVLAEL